MLMWIYIALWLIASGFLLAHTMLKKGGVISSAFMTGLFVALYYPSTRILVETDAGLITSNEAIAGWLAIFGALVSSVILLFALFGLWGEEDTLDEQDTVATDQPQGLNDITRRL